LSASVWQRGLATFRRKNAVSESTLTRASETESFSLSTSAPLSSIKAAER